MPVVKVPVVHKFGIVSVSRAEQLLQQSRGQLDKKPGARSSRASEPTKISLSFITKYNATPETKREKLDSIVRRAFTRAKYRAGLHKVCKDVGSSPTSSSSVSSSTSSSSSSPFSSTGGSESVSDAWLEFILLCQCYGPHQEEVLLALATSLNHAPISTTHIPSLLYMAGLCFQWLKSDLSVGQAEELRTGELILLRILYLTSLRVFYHHMVGSLQDTCTREDVRQLKFDIEGFESREKVYRIFPEALLHWKVALEVGQIVTENYSQPLHDPSCLSKDRHSPDFNTTTDSHSTPPKPSSNHSGHGGHGGHGLSPVLWHSLDVWQVVRGAGPGLEEEAISDFVTCSTEFDVDNWMESLLAIHILCTASQLSLRVLQFLQSLASGTVHISPSTSGQPSSHQPHTPLQLENLQSASLLRDTASPSQASKGYASVQDDCFSPSHKKGTRFKLPVSEKGSSAPSKIGTRLSSKRRTQVDTLNVLGVQPGFREPYPDHESVITIEQTVVSDEESSEDGDYYLPAAQSGSRCDKQRTHSEELESVATQSLVDSESVPKTIQSSMTSSQSQQLSGCLGSQSTLGDLSPSQSIMLTSGTSKNLKSDTPSGQQEEGEGGIGSGMGRRSSRSHAGKVLVDEVVSVQGTLLSPACTTPMEEKLEAVKSPLSEAIGRINLLDNRGQFLRPQPSHPPGASGRSVTLTLLGRNVETRCTHYTHSSAALSGGAGVPGSHVAPSTVYRHSVYSVPRTIDTENEESAVFCSTSRFERWPNEVALAFTLTMGCVAIYGKTSLIQSMALEGMNSSARYGLKQLAVFSHEDNLSKCDFSSWIVRHGAVLGLSRVCHTCKHLPMKDGLSSVAWSSLVHCHSSERDQRVLRAFKLSQVCPDLDEPLLATDQDTLSSPLLVHMADGLAKLFFSPVTPKTVTANLKTFTKRPRATQVNNPPQEAQAKVDTKLRRGVSHPPDFITRTLGALNKIVEEDWRREMQREREEELKERLGEDRKEEHCRKMFTGDVTSQT